MASDEVVVKVTPDGSEWHVDVADKRLLTLRNKATAVAEAYVQAVSTRPCRVVVYGADGSVEEETPLPSEGVAPEAVAAGAND
ncbi:MAG TPA: hypothetical protein VF053_18160 [Streptosporangiales bacterium]